MLQGKTVRIGEHKYTVRDQSITEDNREEVITLTREISVEETLTRPRTIYDLGYSSKDAISFSEDAKSDAFGMLDNGTGKEIEIAIIDRSGLIELRRVLLRGLSMAEPTAYKLTMYTPRGEEDVQLTVDHLIDAYLLASEFSYKISEYETAKSKIDNSGHGDTNQSKDEFNPEELLKKILGGETPTEIQGFGEVNIEDLGSVLQGIFKQPKTASQHMNPNDLDSVLNAMFNDIRR